MKTSVFSLITAIFGTSLAAHAATIYSQPFPTGTTILPMNTTGVEWNAKRDGATYDPPHATGPATGSFNGLHAKGKFLAINSIDGAER